MKVVLCSAEEILYGDFRLSKLFEAWHSIPSDLDMKDLDILRQLAGAEEQTLDFSQICRRNYFEEHPGVSAQLLISARLDELLQKGLIERQARPAHSSAPRKYQLSRYGAEVIEGVV